MSTHQRSRRFLPPMTNTMARDRRTVRSCRGDPSWAETRLESVSARGMSCSLLVLMLLLAAACGARAPEDAAADDDALNGGGLAATYYDNIDFTGATVSRVDPTVNFDWGSGSPDSRIGPDTFSARWTGSVMPRYSETYRFYTVSDDGVRLWVNGQQLINNWTDHSSAKNSGTIALAAGRAYSIRMDFYENGGQAVAKLSWSSASQAVQIIPSTRLSPSTPCPQVALDLSGAWSDSGYSWGVWEAFGVPADTSNALTQSTLRLFENGHELGPAHSTHVDIRNLGLGRFSHWSHVDGSGEALRFSASDNSNPTTNGRAYSYCTGSNGNCTPACSGKQCGPDGCGGSCGTCLAPQTCGGTGSPNLCGSPPSSGPVLLCGNEWKRLGLLQPGHLARQPQADAEQRGEMLGSRCHLADQGRHLPRVARLQHSERNLLVRGRDPQELPRGNRRAQA